MYLHHHHDMIDFRYLYDNFITSIAAGSFAGLTSLSCLYERVHITAESSSIRFFSQSDGVQLRHADHPRLAGRPHAACLSVWCMHAHTLSCVLTPVIRWLYHNSLTSIQTASFSGLTSLKSLSVFSLIEMSIHSHAASTSSLLYSNDITLIESGSFLSLTMLRHLCVSS